MMKKRADAKHINFHFPNFSIFQKIKFIKKNTNNNSRYLEEMKNLLPYSPFAKSERMNEEIEQERVFFSSFAPFVVFLLSCA